MVRPFCLKMKSYRQAPINFFNKDKTLNQPSPVELNWRALTTGNIGGFDMVLADPYSGTLKIENAIDQGWRAFGRHRI